MGHPWVGESSRQPEVGDPDATGRIDEQIGRFDVAMDHAVMMGVGQRLRRLEPDLGDPAKIGRARGGSNGGAVGSSSRTREQEPTRSRSPSSSPASAEARSRSPR